MMNKVLKFGAGFAALTLLGIALQPPPQRPLGRPAA